MRRRRRNRSHTAPESARRIRMVQNLLLLLAGLVTAYLVFLAMMTTR